VKIAILGAGAMGSLFGARLAEAGNAVTLVDVNAAHMESIARNGLVFDDHGDRRVIPIAATTDPATVGRVGLILLFCKHLHTRAAMKSAAPMIGPETILWTLQNGIGNVEIIQEFLPPERIAKGLTSVTAIVEAPGSVTTNFKGVSESFAWPVAGAVGPGLTKAVEIFTAAGLPSYLAPDIDYRIWRKLVVNAGLTMLSASVNVGIGPVGEGAAGQRLLSAIVAEVAAVARASGVDLKDADALAYLEELRRKAFDHIGSTTVDLQNGRATEVGAMNGAVVAAGKKLGVPTPVNAVLTDLVLLLEETRRVRLSPAI